MVVFGRLIIDHQNVCYICSMSGMHNRMESVVVGLFSGNKCCFDQLHAHLVSSFDDYSSPRHMLLYKEQSYVCLSLSDLVHSTRVLHWCNMMTNSIVSLTLLGWLLPSGLYVWYVRTLAQACLMMS